MTSEGGSGSGQSMRPTPTGKVGRRRPQADASFELKLIDE